MNNLEIVSPNISICIPTFNRPEFLKIAIESALNQDYEKFDVVIACDGNSVETFNLVQKFNSEKIKIFTKEHSNVADTRNFLIKHSTGEFILWLDDDDVLEKNILSTYIRYLNKFKDAQIFYCKLKAFRHDYRLERIYEYNDWYSKQNEIVSFLIVGQPIPNGGTLIKRSVFEEIGVYNVDFNRAEDYEFYSRVFVSKKFNSKFINEFLYNYRFHEKNITLNLSGKIDFKYETKILRRLITNYDLNLFFPQLKNSDNYKKSLAEVYYILGIKFFNYGAYSDSVFYLTASLREERNLERLNHSIQGFIDSGVIEELKVYLYMVKGLFEGNTELEKVIEIIDNYKE